MNAMQPPQSIEEIKAGLETTEKGGVRQSIRNCLTVFQRDPLLSGAIAYNILTDRKDIIKPIGFHRESTALNDTDMKYLLLYLEETYGLTNEKKIDNAIGIVANENKYHPIRDYLNKLLDKQAGDRSGKIYGLGHAVYTMSDPRAVLLKKYAQRMAELKGYADELEGAEDFTSAAIALVKRTIRDHRRVIFNGNGYTAEWEEEAARRGLPNKKNTPAALPALVEPKNIQLMEEFGVLTKVEMESRYEVEMEHYSKIINIEALTMLEMARKQLLPAINAYMSEVANTAASKLAVSEAISVRSETKTLTRLSTDADAMSDAIDALQAAVDTAEAMTDESAKAVSFHDDVLPRMDALRAAADDAETICGEDYWPLPSYSKMLYYV